MQKLDKRGKGILLMHDIHKRTAQALPVILAQLKAKGYKVVHMTAKAPVVTLAEYDNAIEKEAKGLPQVGAERPLSSIVKTVGGTPPKEEAPAPAENETAEPEGIPQQPSLPAFPSAKPPGNAPAPGKQSSNETGSGVASVKEPTPPPVTTPVADTTSRASAAAPLPTSTAPDTAMPGSTASVSTASVVRTVSADDAAKSAAEPAPPDAKNEAPKGPHKTFAERAKETWRLWFGE
jgi:hypothetical protein